MFARRPAEFEPDGSPLSPAGRPLRRPHDSFEMQQLGSHGMPKQLVASPSADFLSPAALIFYSFNFRCNTRCTLCSVHTVSIPCAHCAKCAHRVHTVCTLCTMCTHCAQCAHTVHTVHTASTLCTPAEGLPASLKEMGRPLAGPGAGPGAQDKGATVGSGSRHCCWQSLRVGLCCELVFNSLSGPCSIKSHCQ
jgi:hypothetical protein